MDDNMPREGVNHKDEVGPHKLFLCCYNFELF